MGAKQNLAGAIIAVKHVEKLMTTGASNKFADLWQSLGASLLCVAAQRSVEIAVPWEQGDGNLTMPSMIRGWAAKATHMGCGNCGEQAAIAFEFLRAGDYRPLEYVIFDPGDHAFVVIGRRKGSQLNDIGTWGPEAVVCDAWDGKAYLAREIPQKMHKKHKKGFFVMHRIE